MMTETNNTPANNAALAVTCKAALADSVAAYLAARAVAEVLRKEINGYKAQVLAEEVWMTESLGEDDPSVQITEPTYDWLMSTADFERYHPRVVALERAAGHDPALLDADKCPALVAESAQCEAEWAVVDGCGALLVSMGHAHGAALQGRPGMKTEDRQKVIDLACRMVLSK